MENQFKLDLRSNYLRDIWQEFCEKHTQLYEVTCDEYMHLMASEMDELEECIDKKGIILKEIDQLDEHRQGILTEISNLLSIEKPNKMSELLERKEINQNIGEEIEKLNLVLVDIVEKIVAQNKKNQFFLNKALHSLHELKESFGGKVNYDTYSSSGTKTKSTSY